MPRKVIFLCQECRGEWEANTTTHPKSCFYCGSSKTYKSFHHQRYAKKSRSKQRWSYRVK